MTNLDIKFFDLNSLYGKQDEANNKLLDSPVRLMDIYLKNIILEKFNKSDEKDGVLNYEFTTRLNKEEEFICSLSILLNNQSLNNKSLLNTDGYFVFINLEDENTKLKIDKVIDDIKEYCDGETKTFFIGVHNAHIIPSMKNIKNEISKKGILFEYTSLYAGSDENKCLYSKEGLKEVLQEIFGKVKSSNNKPIKINHKTENKKEEHSICNSQDCNIY